MGDTGSLSLGGSLAAIAIIVKHEIVLAIIGGLFVLETVSVIIQVISFKLTGRRIFKMAPIHHHFEKKGLGKSTIVIRFWIIAIILALSRISDTKTKVKMLFEKNFKEASFLIYGLGLTGHSVVNFFKKINKELQVWDDKIKDYLNIKDQKT